MPEVGHEAITADIEIGAVEIKDATVDTRAKVAATGSVAEGDNALVVHSPVLGTTTGVAVSTDAAGTIQQYLRGLVKLIVDKITVTDLEKIAGVVPQMDDTDKLAVSLHGKASAAGDTPLVVNATKGISIYGSSKNIDGVDGASNTWQTFDIGGNPLRMDSRLSIFNGTNWDRKRNNIELTLLANAARTVTTPSADQVNYNHRGLVIIIDVTARASATTLTPSLQIIDPIGGDYITIWTVAAAIDTANGSYAYLFYPSPFADAAELYTEAVDITLPRGWRVNVVHSDSNSITYSVAGGMIL